MMEEQQELLANLKKEVWQETVKLPLSLFFYGNYLMFKQYNNKDV